MEHGLQQKSERWSGWLLRCYSALWWADSDLTDSDIATQCIIIIIIISSSSSISFSSSSSSSSSSFSIIILHFFLM